MVSSSKHTKDPHYYLTLVAVSFSTSVFWEYYTLGNTNSHTWVSGSSTELHFFIRAAGFSWWVKPQANAWECVSVFPYITQLQMPLYLIPKKEQTPRYRGYSFRTNRIKRKPAPRQRVAPWWRWDTYLPRLRIGLCRCVWTAVMGWLRHIRNEASAACRPGTLS